jgi:hypothetical protein
VEKKIMDAKVPTGCDLVPGAKRCLIKKARRAGRREAKKEIRWSILEEGDEPHDPEFPLSILRWNTHILPDLNRWEEEGR